MNWIILIIAGLCETGFAFCLGKMKGLTGMEYYLWGTGFLAFLSLSMLLLARAVQTIPIGTAYPVWTGIGAAGTVILGILFFHEPATFGRARIITDDAEKMKTLRLLGHRYSPGDDDGLAAETAKGFGQM